MGFPVLSLCITFNVDVLLILNTDDEHSSFAYSAD